MAMSFFFRVITIVFCALAAPAGAQELSSAYTTVDLRRHCKHLTSSEVEDYGSWRCKGFTGVALWAGAGDQRMFISFGPNAEKEPAAEQTLGPFNDFYKGVVEWRQIDGKPFATIIRWNFKRASDKRLAATGRVLVVTRLPPGPVCHVGYVDALANSNANELARQIADAKARDFNCGKDKPGVAGKVTPGDEFVSP